MEQKVIPTSPSSLIIEAVKGGADLTHLEKLLSLQERYDANEAKKAYHKAMAEFKVSPPKIEKDHLVSYGNTSYKHATLANITEKINTSLSKQGLSVSWTMKQNGAIMVTCKITHVMGHSEETTLAADADTSGSKNAIQAIGSAITYLQRYTLLSLTGLAAHDQDDDGKAVKDKVITEEEIGILDDWMVKVADVENSTVDKVGESVLKYLKIDKLDTMTKKDYDKAISALRAKANK